MNTRTTLEALLAERAWLRRVAHALVREPGLAEDLVQETYVRALEGRAQGIRSPRAWLGTVIRNLARNHARTEQRRAAREEALMERRVSSPEELVERAQFLEVIASSVLTLDEPYRTTILLRYFEELPPGDVARRMNVPLETVRTRLKRGLRTLRARLDSEHDAGRGGWIAALLPLVPTIGTGTSATAASLAGGVLVMSTGKKLVLATLLLLLGVWAVSTLNAPQPEQEAKDEVNAPVLTTEAPTLGARDQAPPVELERSPMQVADGASPSGAQGPGSGATLSLEVVHGREPMEGLLVRVIGSEESEDDAREATTDGEGAAQIAGLANGAYDVWVRVSEGMSWRRRVPIRRGAPIQLVVRVPTETVVLSGVVRSGSRTGPLIEGASVRVSVGPRGPGERFDVLAQSDRAGQYSLTLPRGHIKRFTAKVHGFAPWPRRDAYRELFRGLYGLARGENAVQDIVLVRGASIHGRAHTRAGEPIAGVRISFGKDMGRGVDVETDAEGRYEATGLNAGEYRVSIDMKPWFPMAWPLDKITVTDEGRFELDFELQPGRALSGVVYDSGGSPVSGAQVFVVTNGMARLLGHMRMAAETDALGRWTINPVEPWHEEVALQAKKEGLGKATTVVPLRRARPASARLVLAPVSQVGGVVKDVATGSPIADARVVLRPVENDGRIARFMGSGADGTFRFEGLVPGAWRISTYKRGYYASEDEAVEVKAGHAAEVTLTLDEGEVFAGLVVDGAGNPVARAHVYVITTAVGEEDPKTSQALSDNQGRFSISRVKNGEHEVYASHGSSRVSERLELHRGARGLELRLGPRVR